MSLRIFILGGIILIVSGILQALVRPRIPRESPTQRLVNGATVRAAFFVLVGVAAILVGLGVIPLIPLGG